MHECMEASILEALVFACRGQQTHACAHAGPVIRVCNVLHVKSVLTKVKQVNQW